MPCIALPVPPGHRPLSSSSAAKCPSRDSKSLPFLTLACTSKQTGTCLLFIITGLNPENLLLLALSIAFIC